MTMHRTLLRGLTATALLVGGLGSASAALITEWSYYNEAGFTAYAPNPGITATGNSGTELGLATTLSWGITHWPGIGTPPGNPDGEQSQLISGGNVAGTATTNGGPNAGVTLIHNNRTIWDGSTILESATLQSRLWLTPTSPAGSTLPAREIFFDILFEETLNSANPCADGGANSTGVNINGCADIFVVANPASLVDSFLIDDHLYTITIGAAGLGTLSNSACAVVGQDEGCVGFLTIEQQSNLLSPFFTITASPVQVPVPATAALFGIGLLALGGAVRRRRS